MSHHMTEGRRKRTGKKVLRAPGKKPIAFRPGRLHHALGVPIGKPIPAGLKNAALSGKRGPLIKKMAVFAFKGALAQGRKTAARHR